MTTKFIGSDGTTVSEHITAWRDDWTGIGETNSNVTDNAWEFRQAFPILVSRLGIYHTECSQRARFPVKTPPTHSCHPVDEPNPSLKVDSPLAVGLTKSLDPLTSAERSAAEEFDYPQGNFSVYRFYHDGTATKITYPPSSSKLCREKPFLLTNLVSFGKFAYRAAKPRGKR